MKKMKLLSILVLLILLCLVFVSRSKDLKWNMLPEYQGDAMEGYVYLTSDDDKVYVSTTVYYDNTGLRPTLLNEDRFDLEIDKIMNHTDENISSDVIKMPDSTKYYRSSVTITSSAYFGDENQIKELKAFIHDFDYHFVLIDDDTGKCAYKLHQNFRLSITD